MPGANPLTMSRKELETEVASLRAVIDQKIQQLRLEREDMAELIAELQEQITFLKSQIGDTNGVEQKGN